MGKRKVRTRWEPWFRTGQNPPCPSCGQGMKNMGHHRGREPRFGFRVAMTLYRCAGCDVSVEKESR